MLDDGTSIDVRVIMKSSLQILNACFAGGQVTNVHAQAHIGSSALEEVLADWSEFFPGYHLYYPKRRQKTAAFKVVVEALRCE